MTLAFYECLRARGNYEQAAEEHCNVRDIEYTRSQGPDADTDEINDAAARDAVPLRVDLDLSAPPPPELMAVLALLQRWCGGSTPPKFIQLTRGQLRELAAAAGEPERVARIENRAVPGPKGDIPIRIYTPEGGSGPLPILVYFHGGGWVFGRSLSQGLRNHQTGYNRPDRLLVSR